MLSSFPFYIADEPAQKTAFIHDACISAERKREKEQGHPGRFSY